MSFNGRTTAFSETVLSSDGFYPEISLGEFQNLHRLPGHLANETLEHQARRAVIEVKSQLNEHKKIWAQGVSSLSELDAIDDSDRVTLYKSAVFYLAKARLLYDYQSFTRKDNAENTAKEGELTYQFLLSESRKAVKALKGELGTIGVELL